MKFTAKSLADMAVLAKQILSEVEPKGDVATVLCLSGDLGAGKTTFTQALARELGVAGHVTSPTFVIEKKYKIPSKNKPPRSVTTPPFQGGEGGGSSFQNLIHIDCYRLSQATEMDVLGWSDIVADPKNLIAIEWPERISNILPKSCIRMEFNFIDEETREIQLKMNLPASEARSKK